MKALVVVGPTASGKTTLAVECAKRLNGEVISADALLVYKGLNIGTAKPTKDEMGGIPHHMIDVVEPTEAFSVSDYERLALPILKDTVARGKVPILCGGTAFYMRGRSAAPPGIRPSAKSTKPSPARRGRMYSFGCFRRSTPNLPQCCTPMTSSASCGRLRFTSSRGERSPISTMKKFPDFPTLRWG